MRGKNEEYKKTKKEKELSTKEGKIKKKTNFQQRNKRGKIKKQSEIAHIFTKYAHGFTYNI